MSDYNAPEGGPMLKKGARLQVLDDSDADRWKMR
jgi:hypothetical protein